MSTNEVTSGWNRVAMAIEEIRERLLKTARALEAANVPYAVVGGNAVAEWVGRIDKAAVRFTQDVDILLRREDLPQAIDAMKRAGFFFHETMNVPVFIDGEDGSARDAVHVLFANEKVKDHDEFPAPSITESEDAGDFRVLSLESLVVAKLTSFRDKDRVHIRDMLEVGLIDASWTARLPMKLSERLQQILDNPE